jgi:hypothetical protein
VWPRGHLSVYLGELGRRADALAAVQEAIIICQELAARVARCLHQELEQSLGAVAWLKAGEDLSDASPRDRSRDNGPLSGLPAVVSCTSKAASMNREVPAAPPLPGREPPPVVAPD